MKIKAFLCALLLAPLTLISCDDDDELKTFQVPSAVQSAFNSRFPGQAAKWELDRNLYNAEFWKNGQEVDAWFQTDGTWIRTETDVVGPLPDAVQAYLTTHYPTYVLDDADWIETPAGSYYELELERNGAPDLTLLLKADGTLYP